MEKYDKVLAIDGPCGSGKSSVAKLVAQELGSLYVDTGSMYRAIGLYFENLKIKLNDSAAVEQTLSKMLLEYGKSADQLVVINGTNLTQDIREHRVSQLASEVSKLQPVRDYLLQVQRKVVTSRFCVMEGRDIGTVVFPSAFCKVYLTASEEVRATRRYDQLKLVDKKSTATFEQVLQDVKDRDEKDMNREIAPLKQAEDACLVDSSTMDEGEVIALICKITKEKASNLGFHL